MRRGHQARIPVFLIMDVLRRRETPGAALSLRKGPKVRGWGAWGPAAGGGGGTLIPMPNAIPLAYLRYVWIIVAIREFPIS